MKTIPLKKVKPGMVIAEDVHSPDVGRLIVIAENTMLNEGIINKLDSYGIREVKIITQKKKNPFLVKRPEPLINEHLREDALENLEDLFNAVKQGESAHNSTVTIVKHLDSIVGELVGAVMYDEKALVNISDLRSYDEYTYHHSLSVAVLSIAIGQSMGLRGAELEQIGRCGIMHDIGKTAIPIEVLNKPAKLSAEEFEIIKTHSEQGYKYLCENNIGDETIRQGVVLHHEKYDGTGYPFGIEGEKIPLYSRVISIADVYDALTSNRPYRSPMQPAEAIEYIMANVGTSFDYNIVTSFLRKLELYPVGSLVELSTRDIATVIDNAYPMRPVVKSIETGGVMDLNSNANYFNITITRVLPDVIVS